MEILAKHIEARSFGMNEEEAAERAIFVLVKKERLGPPQREYCLTYKSKVAADAQCRMFNSAQTRWVYSVESTHFSGPMD